MKVRIVITGQISGNFKLRSVLPYAENVRSIQNGFSLDYLTKKEAVKALSEGNKTLKSDFDTKNVTSYVPGHMLTYDASKAVIIEP